MRIILSAHLISLNRITKLREAENVLFFFLRCAYNFGSESEIDISSAHRSQRKNENKYRTISEMYAVRMLEYIVEMGTNS